MMGGMEEGGGTKWERRNRRKKRMGKEECKKGGREVGRIEGMEEGRKVKGGIEGRR